jgi:PAS domain S-box-containing protein
MTIDPSAGIARLCATVRDLLALTTIPEAWVGREPPAIATDLADLLIESLEMDFAFVRLCDPTGRQVAEVTRGSSWKAFPEWLEQRLAVSGQISRNEIVTNVGGVEESCRGIVIPIGVNSERGLVAAASDRSDFPDQIDQQLLSVAANNAATAFQNAFLITELRSAEEALRDNERALTKARDELEIKVAERTSELGRSERELREQEAELRQMLDLTPQLVAVFGPDRERLYVNRIGLDYLGLTLEEWRQTPERGAFVHPDDRARELDSFDRARSTGLAYELELRLRKGDGSYRWFLVRSNPVRDNKGQIIRWYLACTDIDDRKTAEERLQQENVVLREEVDRASMFEEIVGASPTLAALLSRACKVAGSDSTVLISGETGTGKELVARAIHRRSRRAARAFVALNCAAIPRDLIASELFGHEKGAFTGAVQRRLGRFELAAGGTIFLDEVGELSSETQVALLRVLQEREFERVGGREQIQVDVRVIAATNRDLTAAVADGTFREDLFYRLNVFPLEVPPLRERREDIPMLVEYFIDRYARRAGKTFRRVRKRTLDCLQSYPWPGNVRELQNVIERSVIVSDTDEFTVDESWLSPRGRRLGARVGLSSSLAEHEKAIVENALRETGGRVSGPSGAAARLGIPRSTLEWKIRALKIDKSRFRTLAAKSS